MDDPKEVILEVVRGIVRAKSPEIESVRPDQLLVEDLGLRSLDLARIVAKLEIKLGVDPFAELVAVTSIRTAGDLCAAYAKCFSAGEDSGAAAEAEPGERAAPRAKGGLDSRKELRNKARREQSP
jgi:acyl carrier protein